MNYRLLARLFGIITGALGVAFAMCIAVSLYYMRAPGEAAALVGFGRSAAVALLLTLLFEFLGRNASRRLFGREALATIGLSWIVATLLGALPYLLIVPNMGMANAVFESASGFTTTGASVFWDVESLPRSLLFWRALSQWIGGLGVIVFFVAILSFLGAGAKMLFSNESSVQAADLDSERVQTGVSRLVRLYLLLSLMMALSYAAAGMGWFDAVCHMFTTLSTGGFSTHNASVGWFQSPLIEWLCILFMAVGGTSFVLLLRLRGGSIRGVLLRNSEFKAYAAIIVAATLACATFNYFCPSVPGTGLASIPGYVRDAAFAVVSVMTTTGFATRDFDNWMPVLHTLLIVLMIVGGCTGSTAGGVKVARVVIALRYARRLLERSWRSNVLRSIRMNGRPLASGECEDTNGVLRVTMVIVVAGILLMSFLEPRVSFEGSVSATVACLFNVGPGFAEVGPMRCYADLHIATKYMLSLLMIMGRVELFAILALFAPALWKKF